MTLTIDLPPELEKTVRQQAAKNGQDVGAFVLQAVNEKLAKARTFEQICKPFADDVAASGVTDEELDQLFEGTRQEVWQDQELSSPRA